MNANDEPPVLPGWYMHDARASGRGFAGYTGDMACAATVYYLSAEVIASARQGIEYRRQGCEFSSDRKRPVTNREIRNEIHVRVPYPTVASIPLRDMVRLDADLGRAFELLLQSQLSEAAEKAVAKGREVEGLARSAHKGSTFPWADERSSDR